MPVYSRAGSAQATKVHYDPGQARDESGKWTGMGGGKRTATQPIVKNESVRKAWETAHQVAKSVNAQIGTHYGSGWSKTRNAIRNDSKRPMRKADYDNWEKYQTHRDQRNTLAKVLKASRRGARAGWGMRAIKAEIDHRSSAEHPDTSSRKIVRSVTGY